MTKMPDIIRAVGKTEGERAVYIEDYAAACLEQYKNEPAEQDSHIVLYGKTENESGKEICLIYGVGEKETVKEAALFGKLQEIGCLNMEHWRESGGYEGILTGGPDGGRPIEGYYTFCEENEDMKEYLSLLYKRREKNTGTGMPEAKVKAELTALSERPAVEDPPLYSLLRAAVVCIFVIFCAIAVTTVNSFEKMKAFTETAAQMGRTMEAYDEMN